MEKFRQRILSARDFLQHGLMKAPGLSRESRRQAAQNNGTGTGSPEKRAAVIPRPFYSALQALTDSRAYSAAVAGRFERWRRCGGGCALGLDGLVALACDAPDARDRATGARRESAVRQ